LHIFFHDPHIIVVNKPGGLLSVPGRGVDKQDCVVNRLKKQFCCIDQPSVHRLDMDTSGLMVLAVTKAAHRHLSIQFQNRTVKKQYTALLDGIIRDKAGEIKLAFRLDTDNRPHQIHDSLLGKQGITKWKNLGVEEKWTRIEFSPVTGRTHQLRLHASHELGLGYPIVGDRLYGTGEPGGQLMLHATRLSFTHPTTGEEIKFYSPPPF
jgi:tRNA pseudouridine32 synthase/23S rRNA pseudouridine746 synthase